VFLAVEILTFLFSLTVPNFVGFLRLSYRKFDEDFKNVLETVIFLLQAGFTDDFVSDYPLCNSGSSNFDTTFLSDCNTFFVIFQVIVYEI